jgi:hypothetical protein
MICSRAHRGSEKVDGIINVVLYGCRPALLALLARGASRPILLYPMAHGLWRANGHGILMPPFSLRPEARNRWLYGSRAFFGACCLVSRESNSRTRVAIIDQGSAHQPRRPNQGDCDKTYDTFFSCTACARDLFVCGYRILSRDEEKKGFVFSQSTTGAAPFRTMRTLCKGHDNQPYTSLVIRSSCALRGSHNYPEKEPVLPVPPAHSPLAFISIRLQPRIADLPCPLASLVSWLAVVKPPFGINLNCECECDEGNLVHHAIIPPAIPPDTLLHRYDVRQHANKAANAPDFFLARRVGLGVFRMGKGVCLCNAMDVPVATCTPCHQY